MKLRNKTGWVMRFFSMVAVAAVMILATGAEAMPSCSPTSTIGTYYYKNKQKHYYSYNSYPGINAIPPTNNLLLPTGKAVAAQGQKVTIHGQLLDINCMPVTDASVELWQRSPTGHWMIADMEDLASVGPVFQGAGRTFTDKDGNFTFITAFPGPLKDRAPHVSVRVTGYNISGLISELYFSDDVRNDNDWVYKHVSDKTRSDVLIHMSEDDNHELVGNVKLVVPSKMPYRTY